MDFAPRFSLRAAAHVGADLGFINGLGNYTGSGEKTGASLFLRTGLGVVYMLSPQLDVGLGAAYKNCFGLTQSISVVVGTSFYVTGRELRRDKITGSLPQRPDYFRDAKIPNPGEGIRIKEIVFDQVFPVFHKYYDDHKMGTAVIENQEQDPITDIAVYVLIRQYMDTPKKCQSPTELQGNEAQEIELNALFADSVLEVTEDTKVSAEVIVEYKLHGEWYRSTELETLRLYNRNAMTWDDDRKAAAFVTARDPVVLTFARNITGIIRNQSAAVLDQALKQAIVIHEALDLYGLEYVIDPRTPHIEFSAETSRIDFLQFPRQTLRYRAGDCDDLSILYSALLESVGIETAFITVPGHIFMAFSLDMPPEEAEKEFFDTGELIFREGNTWIPIEVTARQAGFLKAWQMGAQQWREYAGKDQAGFYEVHSAWDLYEPVGLPGSGQDIGIPPEQKVTEMYRESVARFVSREIFPQVQKIEEQIRKTGGNPRLRNKLGILYVKNGLLDKAENEFVKVIRENEYMPALVNLGNLYYLKEQWDLALDYYERALTLSPANTRVLLNIARTHHELENYGMAKRNYEKVQKSDPELAAQFDYLGLKGEASARAADSGMVRGVVLWQEE